MIIYAGMVDVSSDPGSDLQEIIIDGANLQYNDSRRLSNNTEPFSAIDNDLSVGIYLGSCLLPRSTFLKLSSDVCGLPELLGSLRDKTKQYSSPHVTFSRKIAVSQDYMGFTDDQSLFVKFNPALSF